MSTPVEDRPIAGARATLPVVDPFEVIGNAERNTLSHDPQLLKPQGKANTRTVASAAAATHWQFGAQLAIGMVALFVLLTLVVVAFFSIPSSALFTMDAGIGLGIIALSLVLSAVLALTSRHSR